MVGKGQLQSIRDYHAARLNEAQVMASYDMHDDVERAYWRQYADRHTEALDFANALISCVTKRIPWYAKLKNR